MAEAINKDFAETHLNMFLVVVLAQLLRTEDTMCTQMPKQSFDSFVASVISGCP